MDFFRNKFVEGASRNRLLRLFWRMLPHKTRFRIFQRFSFIAGHIEKFTEVLIDVLEKEPSFSIGSDKKEKALEFLKKNKLGPISPEFVELWLQKDSAGKSVFNFNGAMFPYLRGEYAELFTYIFADTFLFSVLFNDNYPAALVERMGSVMEEGPYGYTAGNFDVTVKADDVVIDAGAWIGDFSAYAASRGAKVYAFEPTPDIFKKLQETAKLNTQFGGGGDLPCK
jgi:hypothetical protein